MQSKTKGIVLHAVKYGDSSLIVKILTATQGMKSFMIKGARRRNSTLKASLFIPLTILEMDIASRNESAAFLMMKDAQCLHPLHDIHSHTHKQAIAMFVSEVLYKSVPDDYVNAELLDFIESFLIYLNKTTVLPSLLPHYFLIQYSRFLGLYPNLDGLLPDSRFDMRDGVAFSHDPFHADVMQPDETALLHQIIRASFDEIQVMKADSSLRARLLGQLLMYYKIHLIHLRDIKSHIVLAEVLRG